MTIKKYFLAGLLVALISSNFIFADKGSSSSPTTPVYYTYDDFLSAAQSYQDQFYYDNSTYSPNEDVASIMPPSAPGSSLIAIASRSGRRVIRVTGYTRRGTKNTPKSQKKTLTVSQVNSLIKTQSWPYISIDLSQMAAVDGDLLFVRSNGKGNNNSGYGKYIHMFISSWTHVAIIYDWYNGEVMESMPDAGVGKGYPAEYNLVLAYASKSVVGADDVDKIKRLALKYKGRSYWPQDVDKNKKSKIQALKEFFDINNSSSMYCSKFVYLVFKDYGIDLASHRTKTFLYDLKDGLNNFVGITPDDIWGSDKTTPYWDLVQPENLWRLI